MKKYELTAEAITVAGHILYRIRALKSFASVDAGCLGGFVEQEENLDQTGDAWVYGNAWVFDNAQVYGDARVCGDESIIWISGIGSRHGTTSFFACRDRKIYVSCGCFYGDIDYFRKKVQETHGGNKYARQYAAAIELALVSISFPDGTEG